MQTLDLKQWAVLIGLFGGVFVLTLSALYALMPRTLRRRAEQAAGARAAGQRIEPGELDAGNDKPVWVERFAQMSAPLSKLSAPGQGGDVSALRVRLMNAGWRSPGAVAVFLGMRTALALALPLAASLTLVGTTLRPNTAVLPLALVAFAGIGYYLPGLVLRQRASRRRRQIFEDFPDAIDLMTVCVEAGLGLDAAMMKVAEEIRLRSPVVADELDLLLLELRSGFSKEQALRNFAMRTGVEDIDGFATMLIQAERFGTSIGTSLRVLSDTLRTRRRMRAEETAAKIALKLLFPLMFCIFPTLLAVLMGPAFIHIFRALSPSLGGG
ncbi:Type II/IV secretion system protein TadC, associated with Flp pilus assembly [Paraburkholderia tropica]|uniref:type II secretion system F family protein n=1 Tax=Paraburkholderia tropica TaxID=92647 RepID=UPI001CB4E67E|nr:type II secretion system F family protein [Paraburkholderia tropica]CAG9211930.1 Type II/IV secretion system protein TadC, associated with Flp pilus assembly [Paraburkholderia tropica]